MTNNRKILLFNIGKEKERKIKTLCQNLNIQTIKVPESRCNNALGTLLNIGNFAPKESAAEKFSMEMMVFSGLTSEDLDVFLNEYRNADIAPISLKATVTPVNVFWSANRLYKELTKESAAPSKTTFI